MTAIYNEQEQQQKQQKQQKQKRGNKRKRQRLKLDPSTSTVVVVGAGLAGLSVALSLKRAGFSNVEVFERDVSLQHQKDGYGLTLTYNPKGPLAQLGVLETVARSDCPSRSHYLFHQQQESQSLQNSDEPSSNKKHANSSLAVPMGYFGNAFFMGDSAVRRGYGQRGNLRIPRKVLRKILHDALLEQDVTRNNSQTDEHQESVPPKRPTVHWNKSLLDFRWEPTTQQYHVRFVETQADLPENVKITTVVADLLVAADGIRSAVLQQLYNHEYQRKVDKSKASGHTPHSIDTKSLSIREFPERYGLRPMSIRLILGIAEGIDHPLLRERGFYTVDTHGHRLFTMPYYSDRFDTLNSDDLHEDDHASTEQTNHSQRKRSKNKIMWQLSFSTESNSKTLDSATLRQYVLDTFSTWHPPVLDLVQSTPLNGIWGTDLMDRDPNKVYKELVAGRYPRLVVCGDALHSMSPFKGQGANQALADGPLLAKCLAKSSTDAALTNWWRETLNRTVPVVNASRKAAQDWHDSSVILANRTNGEYHGFAGVQPEAVPLLVKTLRERNIGPHLGDQLDRSIAEVISEHGWMETNNAAKSSIQNEKLDSDLCQTVLKLAVDGNSEGLRNMSLPSFSPSGNDSYCLAMVRARDRNNRSCLHLSALHQQFHACKWLLTELRILEQWKNSSNSNSSSNNSNNNENVIDYEGKPTYCGHKDKFGKTAYDYALESGHKQLIRLFEVVMQDS